MQFQFRFLVVAFITVIITTGAFAKLRKLAIALFPFACNNGHIFIKFYICGFLKKSFQNIEASLKSEKNNRYFTRRPMHIYNNISLNLLRITKYRVFTKDWCGFKS